MGAVVARQLAQVGEPLPAELAEVRLPAGVRLLQVQLQVTLQGVEATAQAAAVRLLARVEAPVASQVPTALEELAAVVTHEGLRGEGERSEGEWSEGFSDVHQMH